jgi:hypothetical protein
MVAALVQTGLKWAGWILAGIIILYALSIAPLGPVSDLIGAFFAFWAAIFRGGIELIGIAIEHIRNNPPG